MSTETQYKHAVELISDEIISEWHTARGIQRNIIQRSNSGMPARTNVRLSVGKGIHKSCTTLSSLLGTFLWNMTMGYVEYDYGIYQKIFSSLISSYSKVTHVHYMVDML